ncbi:transmembrane protein 154-like isoform X2 [Megalops cyprinoides]|uniref:transmembrane protein 154-like isoform X2 n=1 Tax=Megalops cyprinoides TaxID=118141 RepID=UPI001863F546|nr:transmembrane protein 154-like isoform X2 [Megalops cyprinoides]
MTPLLLLGLLVAALAGRGAVTAETDSPTESPEYGPDVTAESSPSEDTDDTETESGIEPEGSSGDGESIAARDESFQTVGDVEASEHETEDHMPPYMIAVPAVLVALIIAVIVAFVITRRRQKNKTPPADVREEEFLAGCDEKIPTPRFEEDIPSVLELEMEDLDKWAVKQDSGGTATDSGRES